MKEKYPHFPFGTLIEVERVLVWVAPALKPPVMAIFNALMMSGLTCALALYVYVVACADVTPQLSGP